MRGRGGERCCGKEGARLGLPQGCTCGHQCESARTRCAWECGCVRAWCGLCALPAWTGNWAPRRQERDFTSQLHRAAELTSATLSCRGGDAAGFRYFSSSAEAPGKSFFLNSNCFYCLFVVVVNNYSREGLGGAVEERACGAVPVESKCRGQGAALGSSSRGSSSPAGALSRLRLR